MLSVYKTIFYEIMRIGIFRYGLFIKLPIKSRGGGNRIMFVFNKKTFWWKTCVPLSFLVVLHLSGCATPPPPYKPVVTPPKAPAKKERPYVIRQLDRYPVREWKYVVIHHSASGSGNAARFDKYHRENNHWENGLGYHFVIGNGHGSGDGQIEIGNRWIKQIDGAHAKVHEYNHFGVGICLVGNFNTTNPTANQMASLITLAKYLQERCGIPSEKIVLHRSVRETDCPGREFPHDKLLAEIARFQ